MPTHFNTLTPGDPSATSPAKDQFLASKVSKNNPSIIDFLNERGQPSDLTSRTSLGIDRNIQGVGTAQGNTNLLNSLRAEEGTNAPGDSSGTNTLVNDGANNAPEQPKSASDTAFETYLSSLQPSAAVTSATKNLASLTSQGEQAVERARRSGNTLTFAAGEASRVGRDANLAVNAAARNLEALTSAGAAERDISKARFDFEQSKIEDTESARRFDLEQDRLNDRPFELSPGQTRFDAQGNKIASLPSTPKAPKGTVRSGGLVYTPQDAANDIGILESSADPVTGYVDAEVYRELYDAWRAKKGSREDFLSTYNPKNYVDPSNTTLPAFLRPKEGATIRSGGDVFRISRESR